MQVNQGWLVSVNTGDGGVPKQPRSGKVKLGEMGLEGDVQGHEKHRKPTRALSVISIELLDQLQDEGFPVAPALMAENLTVYGVDLPSLADGTRLVFDGGVEIEVSMQRKPCFQLNPVGEGLEQAAVGRSGVMCSVIKEGELQAGERFTVVTPSVPS